MVGNTGALVVLEQRFLSLDRVGAKVLGARRSYVGTWLEQKCWVRGGLMLGRGWNKQAGRRVGKAGRLGGFGTEGLGFE